MTGQKACALLLSAILLPSLVAAGDAPSSSAASPMQQLGFLVGRWVGEGWQLAFDGSRSSFASVELVEPKLDGEAILIEGIHHNTETGERVHHALAMVTWNSREDHYDFRSFVTDRGPGNFSGEIVDGAFVWRIEMPRGTIRYTIRAEDGVWTEAGEFSSDGESWRQVFGMTLQRVSDP